MRINVGYSTLLKMRITALRFFAARAGRELEGETVFFSSIRLEKTVSPSKLPHFLPRSGKKC